MAIQSIHDHDSAAERDRMVELQIASRGVTDRRVLDAMRQVPREAFVSEGLEEFAYEDAPLPIEEKQTISQPYIVAAHDRGGRRQTRRSRPRGRHRLRLRSRGAEPHRRQGLHHRAPPRAGGTRRRSGWPGSAIATSRCATATGRWAGPRVRRSTPSSSRPADRKFRRRCANSSRSAAAWSSPSARSATSRGSSRSFATESTRSTRRTLAQSCSFRSSASRAGQNRPMRKAVPTRSRARPRSGRKRPRCCCVRQPSRCPTSMIRRSARCSTGSDRRASSFWAKRRTALRNFTAPGRRSPAG